VAKVVEVAIGDRTDRSRAARRFLATGAAVAAIAAAIASAPPPGTAMPIAWASPAASLPPAPQPGGGAPPDGTGAAIAEAQQEAARLEQTIAAQQQAVASLSERYDQATVTLERIDEQLAQTGAALDQARAREADARHQLQVAAVHAYMYDLPAARLAGLLGASDRTTLREAYQTTAVGDVDAAIAQLRASQQALEASQQRLHQQREAAAAQARAVAQAQDAARSAADAAQATLSTVRGQLAQLVAQQAAEQAARQAAAAQAAADAAARQQAAGAAEAAAQVAQTLGPGTAAASSAGAAANQAAAAAGFLGTVPAHPPAATGAGAVALRAAEQYLGVPYVWGGASTAGVDCSGLTMLAWGAAGVSLPHSAALQYAVSAHVALSQLEPGDLLFYDLDGTGIDHVVMYVGSGPYGSATIIQAAHTGTVVSFDPVWYAGLVGAGRP